MAHTYHHRGHSLAQVFIRDVVRMKWILVFYVMTGDMHGMQTKEFEMEKSCKATANYLMEEAGRQTNNKRYIPRIKCIPL
jgi:hypothetical protein